MPALPPNATLRSRPKRTAPLAYAIAFMLACVAAETARCQDFSVVPGEVISYEQSPSPLELILNTDVYIADNAIVVLSNGNYLASHSYFGGGSTETTAAITRVAGLPKLVRSLWESGG